MRRTLIWTITGFVLVFLGILICAISFAALGFDIHRLSTGKYVKNQYDITEEFLHLQITGREEDIRFERSEDGECRVIFSEDEQRPHRVSVEQDRLTITGTDSVKWYENFGIWMENPEIVVKLPEKAYGELSVKTNTGDIDISKALTFEKIELEYTIRKVNLENVQIDGEIEIETGSGDAKFEKCLADKIDLTTKIGDVRLKTCEAGSIHLETDTGDVRFTDSDAETIYVKTITGDVRGTLLSDKIFKVQSVTGKTKIPDTETGGICEIYTETGDIRIEIEKGAEK